MRPYRNPVLRTLRFRSNQSQGGLQLTIFYVCRGIRDEEPVAGSWVTLIGPFTPKRTVVFLPLLRPLHYSLAF